MFFGIDYGKGIEIDRVELQEATNNQFQKIAADSAFAYLESKEKADPRIPAFLMGGLVGFIIGVVTMIMAFFN